MLINKQRVTGEALHATDGEIGRCTDLLFDDKDWVVRYFVADTNRWLPGKEVVLSPISLDVDNWTLGESIPFRLTRKQIEDAPPLDEHQPVSREYEIAFFKHFGYAQYWLGPGLWGTYPHPVPLLEEGGPVTEDEMPDGDNHIRSTRELTDYSLKFTDENFGHITDFVIDSESWAITDLVMNTRNWLPGGDDYLLPVSTVDEVSWAEKTVTLKVARDEIDSLRKFDEEHMRR